MPPENDGAYALAEKEDQPRTRAEPPRPFLDDGNVGEQHVDTTVAIANTNMTDLLDAFFKGSLAGAT